MVTGLPMYSFLCDFFEMRKTEGLGVLKPDFRVQGLGLRVQGLGFRVQGLGFRV